MMKRIFTFTVILILLFICGCDAYTAAERYPWYRAENWYCQEIDMMISYSYDEEGRLTECPPSRVVWNDQTYDIIVGFNSDAVWFTARESNDSPRRVLNGTWVYRDGNLVIQNFEEELFGGAIKELVFIPQGEIGGF